MNNQILLFSLWLYIMIICIFQTKYPLQKEEKSVPPDTTEEGGTVAEW